MMTKNTPETTQNTSYNIMMVGFLASLAGLMFGLDIGVMSGANEFIKKEFVATDHDIETIVSSMMFGAALGALSCGWASAKFGRNRCLIVSALIFIASAVGCALSRGIVDLIAWRFILGVAIGIASTTAPLYIAEIAPEEKRGSMISTYQLMVTIGIFLAFVSDTILGYYGAWRWMLGIIAFPAIMFLIGLLSLPDSPRWLVMNNRKREAYDVLLGLRAGDQKVVSKEISDIEEQLQKPTKGFELFKTNSNFRRSVGLGILLQVVQQFTGMNVVMYYAPRIFADMGYQGSAQLWFTALVGLVNVAATFIAIGTCDKYGRKPTLYAGFFVMALGLGIISFLMRNGHIADPTTQYFCVAMLLMFIVGFAMSAGPLVWTLCSEIQPLQGRDFGIAASTVTNWLANFVVGYTFLTLNNNLGSSKTFLLYALLNVIFIAVTFMFIPETSKVSLEKIEENLMDGKPLRKIGR
ncbi:sugar porter family MFS transporter [Commensalibacter oyaizuii]|uniref:Sugar porter family MFS transporter n=1 Tax=Commensalibacter oyaizuii TaxID=3043873 RepID=A0ABT6PZM7_9PROT|nr:sugar porter family MFS transporter [Commensalibacter sp. TBRC 16381]MDI2090312.1 sugar porter family MFS transporter [Commensalibacter sp. TBRC 16381]